MPVTFVKCACARWQITRRGARARPKGKKKTGQRSNVRGTDDSEKGKKERKGKGHISKAWRRRQLQQLRRDCSGVEAPRIGACNMAGAKLSILHRCPL